MEQLPLKFEHKSVVNEVPPRCNQCGRDLDPKKVVWLELNCHTNEIAPAGEAEWSDGPESQGCFAFGPDCAPKVLKSQRCKWVGT